MDKLFMVKPEDRPEGALITVTVLLGMALAGVFFYSLFNYNDVTKFIFFLSLLLLYAGLGLACFSVLAKNEAFVVFRDLSMLCVLVCAVLQFAAALDAPVGDGLGFFFRTLSVLKHFVFIIAAAGLLFVRRERLRGIITFIGAGAVLLEFVVFLAFTVMFGKRSELSGLELVMYESKGIYLETHAYSLAWLFCGAALACMAVPILKNYKEAHGTAAGPAAVPPVYIPPVQPYGQPVYPQQPYQQPTYGQPYPQGYRQQNYQQPYAGYPQPDDHPRDPLFRTYYQPGTQPYPQGRPLYTEEEQLARLDDLYARGVITYQDYQNQKADILDGF